MTAATCTVIVTAAADKCGAPAKFVFGFDGQFGECEAHARPVSAKAAPVSDIGRSVRVHHAGISKVGVIVSETPAAFRVAVPVKPHGKPATTREVRFARDAVRFV